MEKNKFQKRLLIAGSLCVSVATCLRAITAVRGNALDFFIGLLIGAGLTLMIGGLIKLKTTKSA
jgi:hypothetical protein